MEYNRFELFYGSRQKNCDYCSSFKQFNLIASTSLGIYKSTDAGATWTLKSISSSRFRDMQFNPADPSIIYAGRLPRNASMYINQQIQVKPGLQKQFQQL
ncbi:MAG: hypothetical protein R2942_10485 [Ignavibacteria bacterium]